MSSKPLTARVLVVDDDPAERSGLLNILGALGHTAEEAEDGEQAIEKLGSGSYDAIITDLVMPGMDGFALLRRLLELGDPTPVVVLTGYGSVDKAVSIVHDYHAFWYIDKPAQSGAIATLLDRAVRFKSLVTETQRLKRQLRYQGVLEDMVGVSASMRHVFSLVEQVAPTTARVLVTGESGTGKERVAAAIHKLSPRSGGPFVAINCAALPESLIESRIVRARKRSFHGCAGDSRGLFRGCPRGHAVPG